MGAGRYDVIVVGARVAGAATAMLLARQGLRVLAVDRASFPRDTISSHQLQVPGVALLHRWGLWGKLTAAGTPPTRRVRFDADGGLVINGRFPGYEGVDALYSPRRTLRDTILGEAAREAGEDVREPG
jgi:2-polyprenyl-6-methoxyphenol hydroxylase-like FAD-dependent oxidoreductase